MPALKFVDAKNIKKKKKKKNRFIKLFMLD